jgi:hypothetical protein
LESILNDYERKCKSPSDIKNNQNLKTKITNDADWHHCAMVEARHNDALAALLLRSQNLLDQCPIFCTIPTRSTELSRVGRAIRNACGTSDNLRQADTVVSVQFSDDSNGSTVPFHE